LRTIDGGPFQAYRKILGEHEIGDFSLAVVSVPPDALGGPARVRLSIDRARAGLDAAWSRGDVACLVLEDAIVRAATRALEELAGPSAGAAPGSGRVWIDPCGEGLTDRTNARVGDHRLDLALAIDLPAASRRVRGLQAELIFFEQLPRLGMAALLFPLRRVNDVRPQVAAVARSRAVATALPGRGLAALVTSPALPGRIVAPDSRTTIETSHGPVTGLGIPTGITLFVTPGVSGAGAWLENLATASGRASGGPAIFAGPVSTLRASRRSFGPLDLGAFVAACPEAPDPQAFVTEDAPAPLAVAASLVEAVEAGARILVLDDDGSPAGTFEPQDERMKGILGAAPSFRPLTLRLAELRDRWGLSFFIAARSPGSLLEVADSVFVLRDDRIEDASEAVRALRRNAPVLHDATSRALTPLPRARSMRVTTEDVPGRLKVAAWGSRGVRVGEDLVDLSDTSLAGDPARLRAIAALLKRAAAEAPAWRPVEEVLNALEAATARPRLDALVEPGLVDLAAPSRLAIAAALVRWKRVDFRVDAVRLGPASEDLP
jgi:predicted ABC-class ATPase